MIRLSLKWRRLAAFEPMRLLFLKEIKGEGSCTQSAAAIPDHMAGGTLHYRMMTDGMLNAQLTRWPAIACSVQNIGARFLTNQAWRWPPSQMPGMIRGIPSASTTY
eukprot:1142127-Pelagomonas_calceolata.AAC.1